jgi:hypothetical protein
MEKTQVAPEPHHFERPKSFKPVTLGNALKKLAILAFFPMLTMISHPTYLICNTIILGHNYDTTLIAAMGLGGLT